ncbi:LOW QUALITY PROTEIN: protein TASOR-like [Denticeps clupeoides]|uniref:LOW QUALITY PROTEIN: protein TASOR-like n=1 Tax=Denticeps clupeoides TaxID=299321 RepID=UPI0010A503D0|nr:LOW QUALITY PROTEIN: protein TASOR-like [Denticeps clupeoides]
MACNANPDRKKEKESRRSDGLSAESCNSKHQLLSATASATSKQNGEQAGCEDEQMSEQDASERRKGGVADARGSGRSSPATQKIGDELPRRNFQIPRKLKERKGLFQPLPPESREFEDLVKLVSSLYLEASSRGAFTYTKAHLIHSELLEKEFVEKKRELKQAGRTDAELAETYAFLLPEKDKVRSICEKGLAVGHARISMLGNPSKGVYLAKYSDLLQMNPFEVGATGDIVVFRMMKGRVKSIHEHTPKNTLDPTPKFDCHVSKNASKVTSLLSYRAFEHTQQFFYEFAFEELRSRPRHVCPYAVLSFQYKGKESGPVANRLSCPTLEAKRVRRRYTVWSGMLLNKGEELFQISVRSSTLPFLPFRLPEKLDINLAMQLDQVKRKIPSVLFSWDTYSSGREVLKCGMYCSLFEVVSKSKTGNCLSGLIQKLERDRMVLVKPLMDKGFLFLLSSSQMHTSKERRGRLERGVQALFIFQEPRLVTRCSSKCSVEKECLSQSEPTSPVPCYLDPFLPALHHALLKLRSNPPKDVVSGVEHQAMDYLNRRERTSGNLSHLAEYRQNLDDRGNISTSPRVKPNMDLLRSYIYGSSSYQLPGSLVQSMVEGGKLSPAGAEEYSPMSDWGGSDRQPSGSAPQVQQSNGGGQRARPSQGGEYDKDKMEKLLRLIQLHKKALVKDGLAEAGHDERVNEGWDTSGLKRKLVDDEMASVSKSLRTELLINGDPGRGAEDMADEGQSLSLSAVMDSIGICDTDLRERMGPTSSVSETHRLLKLLMATLNRAVAKRATDLADQMPETLSSEPDRDASDIDLRKKVAEELQATQDYLEDQMACSMDSMEVYSPGSSGETQPSRSADGLVLSTWSLAPPCVKTEKAPSSVPDTMHKSDDHSMGALVDTVVREEFQHLCVDIQQVMESQHIYYISQPPLHKLENSKLNRNAGFSPYISQYISPHPVQGYVNTLRERMSHVIGPPGIVRECHRMPPAPVSVPSTLPGPVSAIPTPSVVPSPSPAPTCPPAPVSLPDSSSAQQAKVQATMPKKEPPALSKPHQGPVREAGKNEKPASEEPGATSTAEQSPSQAGSSHPVSAPPSETAPPIPTSSVANSIIGQIKPDIFLSLVEMVQKNTLKFYIHDEVESELCAEIKGYLKSLGNTECNPQSFLENSNSMDKFLVIIQNEYIAAHVHKIPALVTLKKLPSVSFAGVDSLDDVKNRTYNELFVSGGLIVSDEHILSPDSMTLEKLQKFLTLLEEQSSTWQWKVHCKTQKKLKELSRINSDAMSLLTLLTAYQKKHLVEFLPYHECDAPSRHAPDLDCLVKLQAHHTHQRHIILLTERRPDTFPQFSRHGIVIASIDDIMNSFSSLIGISSRDKLPTAPSAAENDKCVEEEDMSLDSEDEALLVDTSGQTGEDRVDSLQPPPPKLEEFRPPLPDPHVTSLSSQNSPMSYANKSLEFDSLQSTIPPFPGSTQGNTSNKDLASSFGVNPHQSYLCPGSVQWSPYSGSPGYSVPSHSPSNHSSLQGFPQQAPAAHHNQSSGSEEVGSSQGVTTVPVPHLVPGPRPQCLPDPGGGALSSPLVATANPLCHSASHEVQSKAMEPGSLKTVTYPDPAAAPASLGVPFGWGGEVGPQQSYAADVSAVPGLGGQESARTDGAEAMVGPPDGLWAGSVGNSACATPNSYIGGASGGATTAAPTLPSMYLHGGTGVMAEKISTPGSSTPNSQGSRTPVNNPSECQPAGHPGPGPARGGGMHRGLLPIPGTALGMPCRGGPAMAGRHGMAGGGYGPRGPPPEPMDGVMHGGFRGRGVPHMPMRSRPHRGQIRLWGYPPGRGGGGGGQDYYSDYSYQ